MGVVQAVCRFDLIGAAVVHLNLSYCCNLMVALGTR
jgi:hypothetical protein